MSSPIPPSNNRQILEEATAWFVEFRGGEVEGSKRRTFAQWLRQSPEHIRAYMEIAKVYARLPAAKSVDSTQLERLFARTRMRAHANVVTLDTKYPDASPKTPHRGVGLFARRPVTVALGIAASIIVALAVLIAYNRALTYETRIGERRTILLEDGSRVELNARSKIRVVFTRRGRNIELLEGQAFFRVARDTHRPFIVDSAGALVRAVGTQFDVYRRESGTLVTVLEGRVSLQTHSTDTPPPAPNHVSAAGATANTTPSLELAAGEQALISSAVIAKSPHANIEGATAWTQGQIEFDETPLAEAVVELNRYTRKPLIIASPSLSDLRISGVYSSTNIDSLLLFLRNQPDLTVTESDTEIRLTRR
jgi:transmembrane sensor